MIRIALLQLPPGTANVVRGTGAVLRTQDADMWLQDGWIWIAPKKRGEPTVVLHPAGCIVQPFPEDCAPNPFAAPPTQPDAGKGRK